jgi:CubicO group peptidase (beta-lactamase class C family)
MSHRSGLRTGSGDLLEDLGFDRDYILSNIDQQPLDPFRSTYHYSNFGYTAGGRQALGRSGRRGSVRAGRHDDRELPPFRLSRP